MPLIRSTATTIADTNGPVTASRPATIAAGDLMLAVVTGGQSTGTATGFAAAGWTPAAFWNNGGVNLLPASALLTRTATASEPSTWSFTRQGTTAVDQFLVHLFAIADADPAEPFVVAPVKADQPPAGRNPVPAPSLNLPDGASALLLTVHIAMFWYGSVGLNRWIPPAGMTRATDHGGAWTQMSTHVADVGAGATGVRTSTMSQTPNQQGRGIALALRPTPAVPSGPEPGRVLLAS